MQVTNLAVRSQAAATVPVPVGEIFTIANEYIEAGRLDAAERMLGHILAVEARQPDALHLRGLIAFRRGKVDMACALMEESIQAGAQKSSYWRNLSEVYRQLIRLDEALAAARRAIALDPADPLGPFNLGMVQYDRLDVDGAIAAARLALELRPNLPQAHMKLGQCLLVKGDFAPGWEHYEWRYQIPGAQPLIPAGFMPETRKPQWDGAAYPHDCVLLIGDQGFGDVVMFMRYIPWALERCPNLAIACSAELQPVLATAFPGLRLFTRWDDCPAHVAICPFSGLPRLAGTLLDTIPADIPYLHADSALAATWRGRLDEVLPRGLKRVGIAWAGRPTHNNDVNRSITLDMLAPLFAVSGVALVSLQKGPATAQVAGYAGQAKLLDLDKGLESFADTMAVMAGLDLVIAVDTSVVHFAGAMGVPVWVMLPHAPDFRWLLQRTDTPWYPSMRLFRHPAPRRWDLVVPEVARALHELVHEAD